MILFLFSILFLDGGGAGLLEVLIGGGVKGFFFFWSGWV
jgi:hypothetical protein